MVAWLQQNGWLRKLIKELNLNCLIIKIDMNKQELKDLTYKMVEERVDKGVELFNSFVFFPVLYDELKKKFSKEYCDMFRNVVLDTCILYPDWKEREILQEVASQFESHDNV